MVSVRPKLTSIPFSYAQERALRLFFPRSPASAPIRYALAVAFCIVAFVLRLLLDPLLDGYALLLLFTLAVAASGIQGGFGPGLLATFLGAFGIEYFFPPKFTFFTIAPGYLPDAARQLTAFIVVGVILSWLSGELRHLRWQAVELATQRHKILLHLRETLADRYAALDRVKLLSGLLPICAACKKICDEEGNWQQIESYISKHSEAEFSHGMCPVCGKQWYGERGPIRPRVFARDWSMWPSTCRPVQ